MQVDSIGGAAAIFFIRIMKATMLLALVVLAAPAAVAEESTPLGKVFELMSALEAKIVKEGEAEAKAFKEFFEWCDDAGLQHAKLFA